MTSPKEENLNNPNVARDNAPTSDLQLTYAGATSVSPRALEICTRFGSTHNSRVGVSFIDPVNGNRLENDGTGTEPDRLATSFFQGAKDKIDLDAIATRLNPLIITHAYPVVRDILGMSPTGFRVMVMSSRDADEHASRRFPASIEFSFVNDPKTNTPITSHDKFFSYIRGTLAQEIFSHYARIHSELIEPHAPPSVIENPLWGGSIFSCEHRDPLASSTSVFVLHRNPFQGIPRSRRIDPHEVPRKITNEVISKFYVEIDELMRGLFLSSIIPEMVNDGIGVPNRVDVKVPVPVVEQAEQKPTTTLQFLFRNKPNLSRELLADYDSRKVAGDFCESITRGFSALCAQKIFPLIKELPEATQKAFLGLRFELQAKF